MATKTITPTEAAKLAKETPNAKLLDVRTPAEYRELHAIGTRLVPLDRLDPKKHIGEQNGSKGGPIFLLCRSGNRARQACEKLIAAGYDNAYVVEGGTEAWEQAGLPVRRGKKMMSLERQVRIAAGSIVFIGSLLSFFVHPYFLAIPGFVGAGLVFAGITDTCGMGMLIAKMPWNQVKEDVSSG